MKFEIFAKIELKNKNGKLVKTINRKCKSYVGNMMDLLNNLMTNGWTTNPYRANCGADSDLYGIQVGIGTTPVAIGNSALETLIAHGNAGGQLAYGAMSIGACVTVGSTRKFTLARTFTNNSGADIAVKEVGLKTYFVTAPAYYLIERTLLEFTIANGTSGTVTYTISVTV